MINVDTIQGCREITVMREERDLLVFELRCASIASPSGYIQLEISCPTTQGRLRLKVAKVQVLGVDNTTVPDRWSGDSLETTLEGFLRAHELAHKLSEPKAQALAEEIDLTETRTALSQAAQTFRNLLSNQQAFDRHLPYFMFLCAEAFQER